MGANPTSPLKRSRCGSNAADRYGERPLLPLLCAAADDFAWLSVRLPATRSATPAATMRQGKEQRRRGDADAALLVGLLPGTTPKPGLILRSECQRPVSQPFSSAVNNS